MTELAKTTRPKDWIRIAFFVLSPVIGIAGTAAYAFVNGVRWWQAVRGRAR